MPVIDAPLLLAAACIAAGIALLLALSNFSLRRAVFQARADATKWYQAHAKAEKDRAAAEAALKAHNVDYSRAAYFRDTVRNMLADAYPPANGGQA